MEKVNTVAEFAGKNLPSMTTAAEHASGVALTSAERRHMLSPKLRVYAARNMV